MLGRTAFLSRNCRNFRINCFRDRRVAFKSWLAAARRRSILRLTLAYQTSSCSCHTTRQVSFSSCYVGSLWKRSGRNQARKLKTVLWYWLCELCQIFVSLSPCSTPKSIAVLQVAGCRAFRTSTEKCQSQDRLRKGTRNNIYNNARNTQCSRDRSNRKTMAFHICSYPYLRPTLRT